MISRFKPIVFTDLVIDVLLTTTRKLYINEHFDPNLTSKFPL